MTKIVSTPVKVVVSLPREHTQEKDTFYVIANKEELESYRGGDTSIALANVVESYDIYESQSGGASGKSLRANHQRLSSCFNKDKEDDIMAFILKTGQVQPLPLDKHKLNHNSAILPGH
ncbi:hypothetical protein HDU97_007959 [Phlyctochytrium planicorne]|nr:hypothetical protein HDU97_007959 [Phlyctochytrium planicorne]